MDDIKTGRLVGADKYGNKYYEDPTQFYGRNRWVEYAPHFHMEYDGSQIPADWYGWMHYKVCTFLIFKKNLLTLFSFNFILCLERSSTKP